MIKKILIGLAVIASLPVFYIFGPLFLPERAIANIYYSAPLRAQVLERLDREALANR